MFCHICQAYPRLMQYTANIYSFLLCPVSTVVSLYGLHLILYAVQGRSYSKKTVISFTIIPLYLEQQLNVNHTVKLASQCGYVVSTSAFRQGVPGSNPIAARKSCEVYPGLGILQPQWNPYPTLTPPSC